MGKSVLQTEAWAELKQNYGWKSAEVMNVMLLKKQAAMGMNFVYAPEVSDDLDQNFAALIAHVQAAMSHYKDAKTIFGRAEFLIPYGDHKHQLLLNAGYIKAADQVQPEWRQEIDISQSVDEILAQMKPKGRYNIGLAKKHGITVEIDNSSTAVTAFAELSKTTASRNKFEGRDEQYYRALLNTLVKHGMGCLYLAKYQNAVLAGAIITFYGERASYLYGASSNEHRNLMAPHLLHFTVMQDAKKRSCLVYDLIGIAPPDAPQNHHWTGITRFKKEFGGVSVHYLGSYDRVYKPWWYKLYKLKRR